MRCLIFLRSVFILLNGLPFLAPNHFAGVTHPFALVRLGWIKTANVGRDLANEFLVDSRDAYLRVLRDTDLDFFWNREKHGMREAETEVQHLTLHRSFESDS